MRRSRKRFVSCWRPSKSRRSHNDNKLSMGAEEGPKFLFRTFGGGWQAAQRVEWLPQIDREATLGAEIDGWIAAYPVRLRSSVSWVIEAFRRVCFGDGCGIFSS